MVKFCYSCLQWSSNRIYVMTSLPHVGDGTQGFLHVRQVFNQLSNIPPWFLLNMNVNYKSVPNTDTQPLSLYKLLQTPSVVGLVAQANRQDSRRVVDASCACLREGSLGECWATGPKFQHLGELMHMRALGQESRWSEVTRGKVKRY